MMFLNIGFWLVEKIRNATFIHGYTIYILIRFQLFLKCVIDIPAIRTFTSIVANKQYNSIYALVDITRWNVFFHV